MGAVRIYKDTGTEYWDWHVRSDGCTQRDAISCKFGGDHSGYCNDYRGYEAAWDDLNSTLPALGGYLNK